MNIGGRPLGQHHRPYVIAEIGVNHDGSLDRAIQLVDAAAAAGADAVKFQFFSAQQLLSGASSLAGYQERAGERDPAAMLGRLELSSDELASACEHARRVGLHAIVTAFSVPLARAIGSMPVDALKTASPDLLNKPLLDALMATGLPMIVSTGAASLDEVWCAAGWLSPVLAREGLALLHCVSAYPTPIDAAQLSGIAALREVAPGAALGYSDHTQSVLTGGYAVAAGACVLEKHLTYDRSAAGPDHSASLEPAQLAEYVRHAHEAWSMLGRGKRVQDIELDVRRLSRQSVVAARAIPAGKSITADDVCIKRPGTGLGPWLLESLIGVRAVRAIASDTPIVAEDVGWTGATLPSVPAGAPMEPASEKVRAA
jgi:N,N'-diacetyllegionaminate synthase